MAKPQIKVSFWVLAALAVGFALRLYFVTAAPRLTGDTLIYGDIARNLLQHHVYGFTVTGGPPRPTLIRVPGYPLFLALCFSVFGLENYAAVLFIQAALDLATCLLIFALARRLFGRRAGTIALWLAALCPFTANYVAAALTETLSLLCIAAAFYGFHRWSEDYGFNRWLWVVATSLACAVLLRPEQGLLAAAIVPAMLWAAWHRPNQTASSGLTRVLPVLIAAVCVVLPLAPWAYRNERTFHVFQPLAPRFANDPNERVPLGFQRWYRTWAIEFASTEQVYWNYDGANINIADLPNRAFDSDAQYAETARILDDYNVTDSDSPDLNRRFDALAEERIAADPIRYFVALPLARLANMLLRPRLELTPVTLQWWKWRESGRQFAFAAFYGLVNLAYLAIATIGFIRWRRTNFAGNRVLAFSMLGYVLLRCALLLTLDNSEPRYTLEFFPILCIFAAALYSAATTFGPPESSYPS